VTALPELPAGYSPVPPGYLASVVTYLEMTSPPADAKSSEIDAAPDERRLVRLTDTDLMSYRALFREVGEPWLWFSRLYLDDAALAAILGDPRVHAFALHVRGAAVGLLELDFRETDACELAFFGLTREAIGSGLGRWLMGEATRQAWAAPIRRFHVHTCTLDHPQAVAFYQRSGFVPVRRAVEVAPDPRLSGQLPPSAGAHAPLIPMPKQS
jgi:GNAT superfamily N-acetyltransferase